jgi:hypothetical protein
VNGPKDIYFASAVTNHVSADSFIETFGTSEADRVYANGNNPTNPTNWIKDGEDKRMVDLSVL